MKKFFTIVPTGTKIDFVSKSKFFVPLSIVLLCIVFFGMFTKGFNFGIDFTGGTVLQIKFNEAKPVGEVRSTLESVGEQGASVVVIGEGDVEYLITIRTAEGAEKKTPLGDRLGEKWPKGSFEILRSDEVGPKVGKELKASALRSLFYSIVFIMIYIWFRFDARFAPGATIAMTHDLILAAGFYIFTGREFTISSIAALLTIAGYSVNDTIVIYDRVREIFKDSGGDLPLASTLNKAINLTLSRTIITSISTIIAIIGLIFFTSGELQSFALAIVIGVLFGTYSTLFVATPFTLMTQRFLDKRAASGDRRPAQKKKKK